MNPGALLRGSEPDPRAKVTPTQREIAEQRETVGLAEGTKGQLIGRGIIGGSISDPPIKTPTLAEAGIDKHLADSPRARTDP